MRTAKKLLNDLAIASLVATSGYFVPVLIVLAFHFSVTRHGRKGGLRARNSIALDFGAARHMVSVICRADFNLTG